MSTCKYGGIVAAATLLLAVSAGAVEGVIVTTTGVRRSGDIKWSLRDKAYTIKEAGRAVELSVPLDEVSELNIPKPKELDAALEAIAQGRSGLVLPVLEKMATEYLMLNWDRVAIKHLAEELVKTGKGDEAIKACERIIAVDPSAAYTGEMAPAYWQALVKQERFSKADELITKAIAGEDRKASAFALIARGDLVRASGNDSNDALRKALRDGYLRIVLLYQGVREAQPEALYKSAQCFEKLGQTGRADQMRTTLKGTYANSEWAKR